MRPTRTTLCKLLFLFLFFSVNQFVSGQTVAEKTMVLHGTVMDSVKKVPIDYATVILQDSSGKGLKSSLTNRLGAFEFSNLQRGRYIIQVMNVGYRNKSFPVLLNSNSSDPASGDSNSAEQMIVDTIYLTPDLIGLKEVSIAGRRPIIKQDIDGITYDLQADPESKVKNVLDMMRKIPMIDVDAEDNIKLKGNSNFRILINGKPSSMMARSPKDALKAISASNILKIEVLTTPPAKYDGEGLAGIINIITNKKIDNGYNGNVNSYYRFPVGGLTTSGSIGVKSGKFGLNVFGGISENISPNSLRLNSRSTTGDFPTSLAQDRINNFDSQYHAFSSSLSFEVDTLNLISADFAYNDGLYKSFNVQNTTLSDAQGSTLESYRVNNVLRNPFYGLDLGLNYELGFKKKKNKLLTLSYKYTTSSDDTDYRLNIEERYQYDNPSFIQVNNGRSAEQTVQLDYYNAFKKLTIEGGIKGIFRNNRSDFQYGTLNDITSTYDFQADTRNTFTNELQFLSI
jgi:ferric enterobactin receptor